MPPLALEGSTLLTDVDLHLFNEGSHNRLYHKLGAHLATLNGPPGPSFAMPSASPSSATSTDGTPTPLP